MKRLPWEDYGDRGVKESRLLCVDKRELKRLPEIRGNCEGVSRTRTGTRGYLNLNNTLR